MISAEWYLLLKRDLDRIPPTSSELMLKGRFLTNMTLHKKNGRHAVMNVLQEVIRHCYERKCVANSVYSRGAGHRQARWVKGHEQHVHAG